MNDIFGVLLDFESWHFVVSFWRYVYQRYCPIAFVLFCYLVWFCCHSKVDVTGWIWKNFFLLYFLEEVDNNWCLFFLECLLGLSSKTVWWWTLMGIFITDSILLLGMDVFSTIFLHESKLVKFMCLQVCQFFWGYQICFHVIWSWMVFEGKCRNINLFSCRSPLHFLSEE